MFPFACPMLLGGGGVAPFNPSTPLGTATEGGYYIGNISDGGQTWGLIYAPKASGQTSLAWKTSNNISVGTDSPTNGLLNCNAMDNASHPAAQWCRSRAIAGYGDWYFPAIDELTIAYNNRSVIVGTDAMDTDTTLYWSSTQISNTPGSAFCRRLAGGSTIDGSKTGVNRVRAMRRVLIG